MPIERLAHAPSYNLDRMLARTKSLRTLLVGVVIAGLLAAVTTVALVATPAPAQAQLATDFVLTVSTATIPAAGTSSEVVVSIDPGQSTIAAVGAIITIDNPAVEVAECVALIGLGVCNSETPGLVNIQTVDPAGWAVPTELFRLTFTSDGLAADAELQVVLTQAFAGDGTQILGGTDPGVLDLMLNGDVDCDDDRNIGDALIIAQYVVGTRTASTCPLADPTTQIDLSNADVDDDGELDIGDALIIARCTVGLLECD